MSYAIFWIFGFITGWGLGRAIAFRWMNLELKKLTDNMKSWRTK